MSQALPSVLTRRWNYSNDSSNVPIVIILWVWWLKEKLGSERLSSVIDLQLTMAMVFTGCCQTVVTWLHNTRDGCDKIKNFSVPLTSLLFTYSSPHPRLLVLPPFP